MDKTQLIITLRKEVEDETAGKDLFETVKQVMSQYPDVQISGHISNHLDQPEP